MGLKISIRWMLKAIRNSPRTGMCSIGNSGVDKELIPALRKSWAETQNQHLAQHGFDFRVDHRFYSERGISIKPAMHRGPAADGIDRKGEQSDRIKGNADIEVQRRQQIMAMRRPSIKVRVQPSIPFMCWQADCVAFFSHLMSYHMNLCRN
ncbi:MobA/MobL family protein [Paenochrobactrum sp. BZR 588]|uniref:MobA/MobL family protein n=1 Tax=unclassified Paenochrobactrum TaxID=2639760 RepID=UPI003853D27B